MKALFHGLNPSRFLLDKINSKETKGILLFNLLDSESSVKDFLDRFQPEANKLAIIVIPNSLFLSLESSGFWQNHSFPCFMFLESGWEASVMASLEWMLTHFSLATEAQTLNQRVQSLSAKTDDFISHFENHLALVTQIHRSLHPGHPIAIPGLKVLTKYIPAAGLGGDYFDVFDFFNHKQLGILLADSHSHKTVAALLTTLMKIKLETLKEKPSFSQNVVQFLNQELSQLITKNDQGLNFFFGVLDRASLHFDFTCCGDITFLLGRECQYQKPDCFVNPLLGSELQSSFKHSSIQALPGDRFFLTSDGLGKSMEGIQKNIAQLLNSFGFTDLLEQQTDLLALLRKNNKDTSNLPDDLTLIQVEIDPTALYVAQSK